MLTLDTTIVVPDTVFVQTVDNETIILDSNTQEYFALNEIGGIFWEVLKDTPNLTQVYTTLKEHFDDAGTFQIEQDLLEFVEALEEKGLIKIA